MKKTEKGTYLINQARVSLKKGHYREAVALLERLLSTQPDNKDALFLLAVASLYNASFRNIDSYLSRIINLDPDFFPVFELRAFMDLKSASGYEQVLGRYLEYAEKYPDNKKIRRGLKKLRNTPDFARFQKNARLSDYVTLPRRSVSNRFSLKIYVPAMIIVSASLVLLLHVKGFFPWQLADKGQDVSTRHDSTLDQIQIGTSDFSLIERISKKQYPEFYPTPSQLERDFSKAKFFIKSGKANQAVVILNRIYYSNASFSVKEKTDFLIRYVMDMDSRNFESLEYSSIEKKPYLYRGYAIKWKGRITNLRVKGDASHFTLMVDYNDDKKLSGIAEVFCRGFSDTSLNGKTVLVKGVYTGTIGDAKRVHVSAWSVQKL